MPLQITGFGMACGCAQAKSAPLLPTCLLEGTTRLRAPPPSIQARLFGEHLPSPPASLHDPPLTSSPQV